MSSKSSAVKGDGEVEKYERGGKLDFNFLPIPERLQYDSRRPFEFTTILNITFGVGSTFSESYKHKFVFLVVN